MTLIENTNLINFNNSLFLIVLYGVIDNDGFFPQPHWLTGRKTKTSIHLLAPKCRAFSWLYSKQTVYLPVPPPPYPLPPSPQPSPISHAVSVDAPGLLTSEQNIQTNKQTNRIEVKC